MTGQAPGPRLAVEVYFLITRVPGPGGSARHFPVAEQFDQDAALSTEYKLGPESLSVIPGSSDNIRHTDINNIFCLDLEYK